MKQSLILLSVLALLVLGVTPALAAPSADETPAPATVEQAAPAAAVAQSTESAECAAAEADGSIGDLLVPEPTPAACDPASCKQQCLASCPFGCFCRGSCTSGYCQCNELCP